LKLISLAAICILMAGCSVWESSGRKCLEQSGLTFYNNTKAESAFVGCSTEAPSEDWVAFEKNESGQFSTRASENSELLVTTASKPSNNCRFRFASNKEMLENTSDAMGVALVQSLAACQP
jgi:hypothetical protein